MRARLLQASAALPADVVSKQLEVLLVQHIDSVDLWRGYIRTTQCSVALCSVPVVLKLYISATEKLHQRRRGTPISVTRLTENSILGKYNIFLVMKVSLLEKNPVVFLSNIAWSQNNLQLDFK